MASLPPALDFPKTEEEICAKWAEEQTFKKQDELALERGDEVRLMIAACSSVFNSFYRVCGHVSFDIRDIPNEDILSSGGLNTFLGCRFDVKVYNQYFHLRDSSLAIRYLALFFL